MANITWTDRTDATTATGATTEWSKDQANPLKAWANSPMQVLGTFAPSMTFADQGNYSDYTASGDVVFSATGIVAGNVRKVKITTDGTHTFSAGTGCRILSGALGQLEAGTYDILFASFDTSEVLISVGLQIAPVIPPAIISLTMSAGNTYTDLVLSKAIYGANDGSAPAALSDLTVTFAQSGGTATAWTASSAKQSDAFAEGSASALVGGETTIRIFGSLTGTPDGNETLTITPADGASLYDVDGNAMSATESSVDNISNELAETLFYNFTGTVINEDKLQIDTSPDGGTITQNDNLSLDPNPATASGSVFGLISKLKYYSSNDLIIVQCDLTVPNDSDCNPLFGITYGTGYDATNRALFTRDIVTGGALRCVINDSDGGGTEINVNTGISATSGRSVRIKYVPSTGAINFEYWSAAWTDIPSAAGNVDLGQNVKVFLYNVTKTTSASAGITDDLYVRNEDYATQTPI
jgi:hypothetical protein